MRKIQFWATGLMIAALGSTAGLAAGGTGFGVTLTISMSTKAAVKLAATKEKIVVNAEWMGDPTKAAAKKVDQELGYVQLGTEKTTVDATTTTVTLTGAKVDAAKVAWVQDRKVRINVNIYSARLGNKENILDCEGFDGELADLQKRAGAIQCKLIGE